MFSGCGVEGYEDVMDQDCQDGEKMETTEQRKRLGWRSLLENWSASRWQRRSLGGLHRHKELECWGATLLRRSNLEQAEGRCCQTLQEQLMFLALLSLFDSS